MNEQANSSSLSLISVYEISKILTSSLNFEKTLYEVFNVLSSYLEMKRGMVCLLDDKGELRLIAAAGLGTSQQKQAELRLSRGVVGKVLASGMPIVIPNLAEEPDLATGADFGDAIEGEYVAFVGVPIKSTDKPLGVLSVERIWDSGTPGNINFESDVRFLTMVAHLIGQAVKLHRMVADDRETLLQETHRLQKALKSGGSEPLAVDNMVGRSRAMQAVFAEIKQAAPSRATVLLRGESGTGKELLARAVHSLSPRASGPFIKLNCAALPENLLESELFGHEKGSFTGATGERKGRFELADKGTLFLDEIGEISLAFQAKLLRVLQEREFERVGGNKTIKTDVRLVCATNKDLEAAVSAGDFRADLYYRINVVPIFVPPLRDRKDDVPALIEHFLGRFNAENGRTKKMSPEAVEVMLACYFPGNVRELENCIQRVATMSKSDTIKESDLPCQRDLCLSSALWKQPKPETAEPAAPIRTAEEPPGFENVLPSFERAEPSMQRERLVAAMEKSGWVQAKAARILGLTPRQIGYALKKHNVEMKRL